MDFRLRIAATLVFCLIAVSWGVRPAEAVEAGESHLGFQAGGVFLDGKLGDLLADDFGFGATMAFGITDYLAVDVDFLYAEFESADEDQYGDLNYTQGTLGLGLRASITRGMFSPYATLSPVAAWMNFKSHYPSGNGYDDDETDTHGFGGSGTLGLDLFVADNVTFGLAGQVMALSTDLDFATGDDLDNEVTAYTAYSGLFRLTVIF
ncbi:outer membrane beta-barrel protein [bacterium]|nr:outer membrane beta-barrel protein [bacterium]MCB9477065.1 outer membrane beta-barrel protein [Deltaproteobacteria bacterium]